jgi:hypothetical protein
LSLFHFDWVILMQCLLICLTFKRCDRRRGNTRRLQASLPNSPENISHQGRASHNRSVIPLGQPHKPKQAIYVAVPLTQ